MARGLFAEINCNALQHNFDIVQKKAPNSKIIAMVKANAYGHGLLNIVRYLPKAYAFGVASIEEALQLRTITPQRIILMEGFFETSELIEIINYKFEIVIHNPIQVKDIICYKGKQKIKIWLKIDTGMHRLGFMPEELGNILEGIKKNSAIAIVGVMSHFSCADNTQSKKTISQIEIFDKTIREYNLVNLPLSLCNSAGILNWPMAHRDFVRPGIMLYGISPIAGNCGSKEGLLPVMSLKTKLINCRQLTTGDTVGYGSNYTCNKTTKIGTIALGYGDGFPWNATNGKVIIQGKKAPIIGRVSMDMISVDLTNIPNAQINDDVLIWGENALTVEQVAKDIGTIPYELLTSLSSRVPIKLIEKINLVDFQNNRVKSVPR